MLRKKSVQAFAAAAMAAAFGAGLAFADATIIDGDHVYHGQTMAEAEKMRSDQLKADFGVTTDAELQDMQGKLGEINKLNRLRYSQEHQNTRWALEQTLANKDADAKEIAEKLAAYREARANARAEADKAVAELKQSLTPRQDAALLLKGTID